MLLQLSRFWLLHFRGGDIENGTLGKGLEQLEGSHSLQVLEQATLISPQNETGDSAAIALEAVSRISMLSIVQSQKSVVGTFRHLRFSQHDRPEFCCLETAMKDGGVGRRRLVIRRHV